MPVSILPALLLANCQRTGAAPHLVAAGLNRFALLGQLIHDLAGGVYRWRQILLGELVLNQVQIDSPETAAGKARVEQGQATGARDETVAGLHVLAGKVENRPVEVVTNADGRVTPGQCNCSHDFRFKLRAGPCRHMQALRRKASATQSPLELGYSGAVATLLALLCTECPRKKIVYDGRVLFLATGPRGLPQGACTSPAISNQIAHWLDRCLSGLARKMGLAYTRYADDLTFSGDKELRAKAGYVLARVRHITREEGFVVNQKKTRVQRQNTRQTVTGLVVNANPGPPHPLIRRLRAKLHRATHEGLAAQNHKQEPNFRAWLDGMIAYLDMSRPEVGQKLRTVLDELTD